MINVLLILMTLIIFGWPSPSHGSGSCENSFEPDKDQQLFVIDPKSLRLVNSAAQSGLKPAHVLVKEGQIFLPTAELDNLFEIYISVDTVEYDIIAGDKSISVAKTQYQYFKNYVKILGLKLIGPQDVLDIAKAADSANIQRKYPIRMYDWVYSQVLPNQDFISMEALAKSQTPPPQTPNTEKTEDNKRRGLPEIISVNYAGYRAEIHKDTLGNITIPLAELRKIYNMYLVAINGSLQDELYRSREFDAFAQFCKDANQHKVDIGVYSLFTQQAKIGSEKDGLVYPMFTWVDHLIKMPKDNIKVGSHSEDQGQKPKTKVKKPPSDDNTIITPDTARRDDHIKTAHQWLNDPSSPQAVALQDFAIDHWLQKYRGSKTISLLVGSRWQDANNLDPNKQADVEQLVKHLVANEYLIIFDADSSYAPAIAKIVQNSGVAVSANRHSHGQLLENTTQILTIENSYLRMQAFQRANSVIIDSQSVMGSALIVNQGANYMLNYSSRSAIEIKDWHPGYNVARVPKNVSIAELTQDNNASKKKKKKKKENGFVFFDDDQELDGDLPASAPSITFSPFDIQQELKSISNTAFTLSDIVNSVNSIDTGIKLMSFDHNNMPIPQGAAFFGGSITLSKYEELVYGCVRELAKKGVTIATGGAGGFMKVANRAAYYAGAHSIGIPLGGSLGASLKNERTVADVYHTLTIPSSSYDVRIPLLLLQRPIVVVAPGSEGTFREVATALTRLAAGDQKMPHIIFIHEDYYGKLFRTLMSLQLPENVKQHLHLVNSAPEMAQTLQAIMDQMSPGELQALKTEEKPTPRSRN